MIKTKLSIAITSALSLLVVSQAIAFKPSNSLTTGNVADYDGSHIPQNHRGITGKVLEDGVSAGGVDYKFSDEVIEKIKQANSGVDAGTGFITSIPHCDGEELKACSDRVKNLLSSIVKELSITAPDFDNARLLTGQALHTIQDFYAHSNYAYLYTLGVKNSIATLETGFASSDIAGSEVVDSVGSETCEWDLGGFFHDDVPTNTFGPRGKTKITSGYFQITDPIKFKCIHGGKGTGINKDHPDNTRFTTARDLAVSSTKHFMDSIFSKVLAKGIADPESVLKKYAGQNEVQLGFIIDTTGSMGSTITGVKSAISQVVTDIKNDPEKSISDFLVMAYGDPNLGSVKIAHDADTMLSNINTITLGVPDGGGDCEELATDGLRKAIQVAPNGSELFLYTDADTKNPSLSSTIITEAKAKKIVVNFFVSGSCSGGSIDSTYTNMAKETGGSVYRYEHTVSGASGTFALINPKFDGNLQDTTKISSSLPPLTGAGSLAPKLASKISSSSNKISPNIEAFESKNGNSAYHIMPVENVAKLAAKKLASKVGDTTAEHRIDVDSSVTNFVLTVDMSPLGEIKLYKPDGAEVKDTDTGVTINTTSVSKTITFDAPPIGEWIIEIVGTPETNYELDIKMNSDIRFISFSFAEEKGREGHTGLFPIDGQPMATKEQFVVAVLGGEVATADIVIAKLDGTKISTTTLTEGGSDGSAKNFVGQINLPTEDFRVYIEGKDTSGKKYQRLYPNVYHGQVVSVKPLNGEHDLSAGSSFTRTFEVENLGVADEFEIVATNSLNYPVSVSISSVSLEGNSKSVVSVTIDFPSDAPINSDLTVILNAISKSNSKSKNSAVSLFKINGDSDGDGASDKEEKGKVGIDENFDGNNDGTPDYQQSNVASTYTANGAEYITLEILGNGSFVNLKSTSDPSLGVDEVDGVVFPLEFVNFTINGLSNGESTDVKIHYPSTYSFEKYYKYGATPDNSTQHWYSYSDVVFNSSSVTVTLTDGGKGDNDLIENGTIIDPAGLGAAALAADTDGDGMPDAFEIANGFNPNDPTDAGADADADGLSNLAEFTNNTDPTDADTDNDGFSDGAEVAAGTSPIDPNDHPAAVSQPIPTLSEWGMIILSLALSMIGFGYTRKTK